MPEVTTIGGAIVLVLIVIGLFCYYKFCVPKTADKEAADAFIQKYKGVFGKIVKKIIEEIDITKYKTVEEFESDVFKIAYDECWKYAEEAIAEATANSSIASLVAKCITKESVEEIVRIIITNNHITTMENKYTARIEETTKLAEEEEARLQAEADAYETGTKEVEKGELEYDKMAAEEAVKADPSNFRQPTDEEGEYDPNDDSQEIVE